MIRALAPLAVLVAAPSLAQEAPAPLNLQQTGAVRCAAAFALGAAIQARGEGAEWPPLAVRGKEFFVRTSAQIMDETGRTRDQVAADLSTQVRALGQPGALKPAMGPCLLMLDESGI